MAQPYFRAQPCPRKKDLNTEMASQRVFDVFFSFACQERDTCCVCVECKRMMMSTVSSLAGVPPMPVLSTELLESMKTSIERMSKTNQLMVLHLLKTNLRVKLNENKSGFFINMACLPLDLLQNLHQFIHFVKDQEQVLQTMEYEKDKMALLFPPSEDRGYSLATPWNSFSVHD